jgi:hypothetical protein
MDVLLKKYNQIVPVLLRQVGYAPYINKEGWQSFVRRPQRTDFPRFHVYVKEEDEKTVMCSLHLDQTRPSYMGAKAHGGDYDSETVAQEVNRMKQANRPR